MPAYRVLISTNAPYKYDESTGAMATPDTPEGDLQLNESGKVPDRQYHPVEPGDILYSDKESFDALTDDDKAKASQLLWVDLETFFTRHLKLKSIELIEQKQAEAPKRAGRKPAEKPAE
jgi:hypothetical protein